MCKTELRSLGMLVGLLLGMLAGGPGRAAAQTAVTPLDPTPRLGLLIPVGPPDYAVILDAFKQTGEEKDGPFTFRVGTIGGVPSVLNIAPTDGPLARSLGAQAMLHRFNIRAFIYAGTSGGHLPPSEMQLGDIVLGAKNVNFGNFFMAKDGRIEAGEFKGVQRELEHFDDLFADPTLLSYMACAATRVAKQTELPAWLNTGHGTPPEAAGPRVHPEIFYYGVQGTSTMWLADRAFIEKTMKVFHEIDEDGDWYSNFVATLYKVPFIEVSVIANNVYEYPETERGLPPPQNGVRPNVIAQRLSNRIAVDLVQRFGQRMLTGSFTTPTKDPFPAEAYQTPKNPGRLLDVPGCE